MERLMYKFGDNADVKILRHLRRYEFCGKRIRGKNPLILDFGCGSGYGSKLISTMFPSSSIVGHDISDDALKFANENNAAPNIRYTKENGSSNNNYVLMLDMVEHLTQEQLDQTMDTLLKDNPKSTFFISTPLNDWDGQSPTNQYHINCFQKKRFMDFLNKYFGVVEMWMIDWSYTRRMNDKEQYGKVMAICKTKN